MYILKDGWLVHVHSHVPGLSLAQIFLWSNNLEALEHIPVVFPEFLDVLLMVNLLSRKAVVMGLRVAVHCRSLEVNRRAAADTHVVVDKYFKFIFGIIQGQQPLEEFRKKWSRLLNEHSNQHVWIVLFRLEEAQVTSILNNWAQ